jgi:hypothetical protein
VELGKPDVFLRVAVHDGRNQLLVGIGGMRLVAQGIVREDHQEVARNPLGALAFAAAMVHLPPEDEIGRYLGP